MTASPAANALAAVGLHHPCATFVCAQDDTIVAANAAAEELCLRPSSALNGAQLPQALGMDERTSRFFCTRTSDVTAYEVALAPPGCNPLIADIATVSLAGETEPLNIVAVWPVAPERGQGAQAQQRAAQRARAAGAMLAHEIKNPLAGIRGAAQLLGRTADLTGKRFIDLICAEVDRIAALVDGMEAFTQEEPLALEGGNIHLALQQAQEGIAAAFPRGIEWLQAYDPSIPPALINHNALVQVLLNLIKNAAEALKHNDGGAIRLETGYRPGLVVEQADGRTSALPIEITVADTGPGAPADIEADIFSPFVSGKREGRGLGLALVDKLVRDMGGRVQYSRARGWTQFRINLAVAATPAAERTL